jgi:hypothetical protein
LVVRCHLVKVGLDDDMDNLYAHDLIIFVFHKISFDYNSAGPFITAFTQAYDQLNFYDTGLQYIDYTLYEDEQLVNVIENSEIRRAQYFWSKLMDDYSLHDKYPLPISSRLRTKTRSGRGCRASFILDSNLVKAQIEFASLHDVSMFHIGLASFFLLIYELNDGTIGDLCVTSHAENRSLVDTKLMIGAFTNLLPYRIQIHATDCFINLVEQIRQMDTDILNHSQLPYQHIISGNKDLRATKIPFHFHYDSVQAFPTDDIKLKSKTKDAILDLYTERIWLHDNGVVSNDFTLKMVHNHSSQTTYCVLECTADCYDAIKISEIGEHFQNLLLHIFNETTKTIRFNTTAEKIGNLSLLPMTVQNLPEIFEELPSVTKTSMLFEKNSSKLFIEKSK